MSQLAQGSSGSGGIESGGASSALTRGKLSESSFCAVSPRVEQAWNPDPAKEMRMKKLGAALALAAVLVLLPAQAASADILDLTAGTFPDDELAALSSTGDPFAVGGGTAGPLHFAFSAHCRSATGACVPSGTAPSGYAVVRSDTFGEVQGAVVCYRRFTAQFPGAVFDIESKKGSGFLGSGPFVTIQVFDSGVKPPSGDSLIATPRFIGGCFEPGGVGGPVTQGNIVVK
jgi:hypothetical protein